ncbi:MAG TPA: phage holin family protein [Fluviicoccus sp.]|jgi:putative membrane protein|nr:phage holin family protein [Fluviicoccus sp.]
MFYQMLVRLMLSACGLGLADYLMDGVRFDHYGTLFWAALLLGVANTVIRPLLIILTLPITVITLGLFLFVVNAATLGVVAWFLPGFHLDGFWPALGAWFLVAMMQGLGNALTARTTIIIRD